VQEFAVASAWRTSVGVREGAAAPAPWLAGERGREQRVPGPRKM